MQKKKHIISLIIINMIILFIIPNIVNANSVEYRGEAEGLIVTKDDFFLDFR